MWRTIIKTQSLAPIFSAFYTTFFKFPKGSSLCFSLCLEWHPIFMCSSILPHSTVTVIKFIHVLLLLTYFQPQYMWLCLKLQVYVMAHMNVLDTGYMCIRATKHEVSEELGMLFCTYMPHEIQYIAGIASFVWPLPRLCRPCCKHACTCVCFLLVCKADMTIYILQIYIHVHTHAYSCMHKNTINHRAHIIYYELWLYRSHWKYSTEVR